MLAIQLECSKWRCALILKAWAFFELGYFWRRPGGREFEVPTTADGKWRRWRSGTWVG